MPWKARGTTIWLTYKSRTCRTTRTPQRPAHIWLRLAPGQIYDVQVPDEIQIHNLEDGHVNVQYDCPDGCNELVAQLTGVVSEYVAEPEGRVLMGPYNGIIDPVTGQRRRIALTAWTRLDTFDDFDEERIRTFIDAYMGLDHHVY